MSVATKLAGAFGFLAVLLAGMMAYHTTTTRRAVATSYEVSAIFSRLRLASAEQVEPIDVAASKYWVTGDPGYRAKLDEAVAAVDTTIRSIVRDSLTPPERAQATRLETAGRALGPAVSRFETAVATGDDAAAGTALASLRSRLSDVDGRMTRLGAASRDAALRRLSESAASARKAAGVSLVAVVVALLLGMVAAGSVVRSIAVSIRRLRDGTRAVAAGNFEYRIDAGPERELAEMAGDFNRMTARLAELDRMKQDFLSKVSHDLKTPLASMQETTRILQDGLPGPLTPKQRRLLDLSHESGERLAAMIGKILDLSALEAGAIALEPRRTDLAELAARTADRARPAATERGIAVDVPAPTGPVIVECDPDHIARVLENLLENAVKFSPRGSTVSVRAGLDSGSADAAGGGGGGGGGSPGEARTAFLSVVDAGPGVPDGEKERIFERFYQASGGRGSRGRGVGLGLTICREIVDAHHGTIGVLDAPAGGSEFIVRLPAARRRTASDDTAIPPRTGLARAGA